MKSKQNFIYYKDSFNYYNLITKIDPNYRLVFDRKYKFFAIINTSKNNQICLKFSTFSFDIIKILQKSRIERNKIIFKEIEENNEKIEMQNKQNLICNTGDIFKEKLYFSSRINL